MVGGEQAQTQQSSTSRALTWIQCKLGKQYLEKKFTLPWESNPGPTPNRGDTATLVASVGLKKNVILDLSLSSLVQRFLRTPLRIQIVYLWWFMIVYNIRIYKSLRLRGVLAKIIEEYFVIPSD